MIDMKTIVVLLLSVILTGCSTVDPCREAGGTRKGIVFGGFGMSACVFEGDK